MRRREIEGGDPTFIRCPWRGPRTQSSHSALLFPSSQYSPVPSLANSSTTLTHDQRRSPLARLCAATLPLREMRRQADCICSFSFSLSRFLSLSRSLAHSRSLALSPSFCAFSLTPSNFLLIVFVASLLSLPPFSFACPLLPFLSLSPLLFQHPCNAAHTRLRVPRALHNTHGRLATLTCGVCGPTSCRGPRHVALRPQRHAARSTGCALS